MEQFLWKGDKISIMITIMQCNIEQIAKKRKNVTICSLALYWSIDWSIDWLIDHEQCVFHKIYTPNVP